MNYVTLSFIKYDFLKVYIKYFFILTKIVIIKCSYRINNLQFIINFKHQVQGLCNKIVCIYLHSTNIMIIYIP